MVAHPELLSSYLHMLNSRWEKNRNLRWKIISWANIYDGVDDEKSRILSSFVSADSSFASIIEDLHCDNNSQEKCLNHSK